MKIGVIDNQADRRYRLEALLREVGHRIEAVDLATDDPPPPGASPEVLLVDWEELSPRTCRQCDRLRARFADSEPLIVAMLQPGDDPVDALRCGADEALSPGFDRDRLRLVLALAERQLQKRRFTGPPPESDRSMAWTYERLTKINRLQCRLLGYGTLDEKLTQIAEGMVDIFMAEFCRIWLVYPGDRCLSDCAHADDAEGHHVCKSRGLCLHLATSSGSEKTTDLHRRVPMDCSTLATVLKGQTSRAVVAGSKCQRCLAAPDESCGSLVCYRIYDATGEAVGVLALGLNHEVSTEEDMLIDTVCKTTSQVLRTGLAEEALTLHACRLDETNAELIEARRELELLTSALEDQLARNSVDIKQLLGQKEQLIRRLGHDLNSPLTPLVALLPLARKKVHDPKVADILDRSIRCVEVIRNLVAKTLRMADVTRLDLDMRFERVCLDELVQQSLERYAGAAHEKSVEIAVDLDGGLATAGHAVFLQELVDNLLSNAVQYVDPGGRVSVAGRTVGDQVQLAVIDNGCGLTAEQLKHVFDEFYKADKSRHDHKTSGLGLSICRQVARLHKGAVHGASDGPGKGCTFTVRLPAWRAEAERAA